MYSLTREKEASFAILSGKYGLLRPEEEIPFYDKLLRPADVEQMVPKVEKQLKEIEPSCVIYFTRKVEGQRTAYFELIKTACDNSGINFEKRRISREN